MGCGIAHGGADVFISREIGAPAPIVGDAVLGVPPYSTKPRRFYATHGTPRAASRRIAQNHAVFTRCTGRRGRRPLQGSDVPTGNRKAGSTLPANRSVCSCEYEEMEAPTVKPGFLWNWITLSGYSFSIDNPFQTDFPVIWLIFLAAHDIVFILVREASLHNLYKLFHH